MTVHEGRQITADHYIIRVKVFNQITCVNESHRPKEIFSYSKMGTKTEIFYNANDGAAGTSHPIMQMAPGRCVSEAAISSLQCLGNTDLVRLARLYLTLQCDSIVISQL